MLHSWTDVSPFEHLWDLRRDFDRLFDEFLPTEAQQGTRRYAGLSFEADEDDNGLTLTTEIPGVAAKDLTITAEGRQLSVSGTRARQPDHESDVVRSEIRYGNFSHSIQIPDCYDLDAVEARHADGILTLNFPKSAAAKPREIAIEST